MTVFAIFKAYKSGKFAYIRYFYNLYWVFYFSGYHHFYLVTHQNYLVGIKIT